MDKTSGWMCPKCGKFHQMTVFERETRLDGDKLHCSNCGTDSFWHEILAAENFYRRFKESDDF